MPCNDKHLIIFKIFACPENTILQNQRTNYPILYLYFSYKSTGKKSLNNRENSPWVIISLILMTLRVELVLTMQGEI